MSELVINNQLSILLHRQERSLLEAMETNGVVPESHCRDGYCGACKCKLVEGEVEYNKSPLAYVRDGEVLPCVARAVDSVKLEDVNYHLGDTHQDKEALGAA